MYFFGKIFDIFLFNFPLFAIIFSCIILLDRNFVDNFTHISSKNVLTLLIF